MKVKRGPAAIKVGGRVSPDITSRCRLDSPEPEPSGTAPGRLSPRPPLQPTHGSAACSFTQQQTPGLLSRLSPASPCRLAVQHFQSNSNLRRKALY
ncbi:hypothetical protein Q8A67_019257 [Cirrhinus molitorella]|uniref:Uncharacterized protein n=1 Tax=Cirrhinus molitorella TaxID=172907 RepID=A0AA88PC19_9TELE|nr:hypothetical protein Q8A67_019257 [Cirrhinus molitorella]